MRSDDKNLKELNKEAELIVKSREWWEEESFSLLADSIQYMDHHAKIGAENITMQHLAVLKDLEVKMDYMEKKGYFEAEQAKKFEVKLTSYFTERMWERWKKEN